MPRNPWYRKYVWAAVILALVAGGVGAYRFFTVKADKPIYLFGNVERGDIVVQVGATGTLAAVKTVQVGTQVSGTIAEIHADFNSEVKKGQLLAKLDPQLLQAQVEQQEANVQAVEATLNDDEAAIASNKANLQRTHVDVLDKQRKLKRQHELWENRLIARDDLDTAQAALDAAIATEKAAQAQLQSSEARYKADQSRLSQARASLSSARLNLEHTIITSPISGTIISRDVDVGQTVAASFSSPTLFTIAADLTKMQVNTNIDEADVGRIKPEMEATFTVDAYPAETFSGTISQVRLAATTVQNVVTYNALIDVPNPQLKLKPGMTTNVKIVIDKAVDTLKIPNSALRFTPGFSEAEMEAAFKAEGEERFWSFHKNTLGNRAQSATARQASTRRDGGRAMNSSGNRGDAAGSRPPRAARGRRVPVWVANPDGTLRPVVVRLGLTDGVQTQVEQGKLQEGQRIVTGLQVENNQVTAAPGSAPPGFGGVRRIR